MPSDVPAQQRRLDAVQRHFDQQETAAHPRHGAKPDLLELADRRDALADEQDLLSARRDDLAQRRDLLAAEHDGHAHSRDRARHQLDPATGWVERHLTAPDRDHAVGNRSDAMQDRLHARQDSDRAAAVCQEAAAGRRPAAVPAQVAGQVPVARTAAQAALGEVQGLQAALRSSRVIGQAQGILMVRCQVDVDQAFALLVKASQRRNVKLRDVAAQVVAQGHLSEQ